MRVVSFFAGLVLGVFAILIAQNLGFLRGSARPGQPKDFGAAAEGGGEREARALGEREAQEAVTARLQAALEDPEGKNLDPLAIALEEAVFERDWAKVQAVAALVRAHGAEWVAPATAAAPVGTEEKTLFDQELELRKKRREAELARRQNAATALAGRTDPATIAKLTTLFESGGEVERGDAALLLARTANEAAIRTLLSALRDPDGHKRVAAGDALATEAYLAGATELGAIVRNEADPKVRGTAVESLGKYEAVLRGEPQHPATQAFLEALRKDASPNVRAWAVVTLTGADLVHGRVLTDALLDALVNDDDAEVRQRCAQTLMNGARGYGPAPGGLDAAVRALRTEKSPEVRETILEFLGTFGDAAVMTALDEFAASAGAEANAAGLRQARAAIEARVAAAAGR